MQYLPKFRMPAIEPGVDDPIIGHILFTDGVRRPVFQAPHGGQYVVEEGNRIDGVCFVWRRPDDSGE